MTALYPIALAELLGLTGAGDPDPADPAAVGPFVPDRTDLLRAAARAESAHRPLDLGDLAGHPATADLEATTLAAALLTTTSTLRVIVPLDVDRWEPYNAARALATLAHAGPGRLAVRLTGGDEARRAGYASVLRALWTSFPREALVLDRAAGRYFDPTLVRHPDIDGPTWSVLGALTIPEPPGPFPVLGDAATAWPVAS
jgi:alkanesulfonate monooxygenase SsuD/methylene tetrahydromethanopterin reductase-like flavin-dependent oxidoreductase (luciferase family)